MRVCWLTIAYLAVTGGSLVLLDIAKRFSSVNHPWEWEHSGEKVMDLFTPYQLWSYSWTFIIFGTLMQLAAVWIWD